MLSNFNNNNIEMGGEYKIIWWKQPELINNYQTFLSKLGFSPDLILMNQNLTNLRIQVFNENIRLNFSRDWDRSSSEVVEDIWPGRVVKEEGGSVSVWYRLVHSEWKNIDRLIVWRQVWKQTGEAGKQRKEDPCPHGDERVHWDGDDYLLLH